MRTISAKDFKKIYGEGAYQEAENKKEPGYFQRVGAAYKGATEDIVSGVESGADLAAQGEIEGGLGGALKVAGGLARSGLRTAGGVAKAALSPIFEAPGVKQIVEGVGEKIAETGLGQKYAEWSQRHPEASKDLGAVLDVAALFGGGAAEKAGKQAVESGARAIGEGVATGTEKVAQTATKAIEKGAEALKPPPPTPLKAVGQVLQGQTRDIKSGVRALSVLDTTSVKTFDELSTKVGERIAEFGRRVEQTLDNTIRHPLKDLKLFGVTEGGAKVSVDYITRSLKQLKELYAKIGDDVRAKNIGEIMSRARKVGLTRREVNAIAKTYGQEFGQKAFSKMGEALTSVNAQAYEHVRKALKAVARKGIKGKIAKELDESMSDLFNLQSIVKKNAEAVNKLMQKIQERGLLERVGYSATKVLNVLTGGSLRGLVGGLLPRGAGYKVMNALDIQAVLERNLKIIQDALEAGDEDLIQLLRSSGESVK